MSLDDFITLYFFRYLRRLLPGYASLKVSILMYHSISDEVEKGHPYFWLNTPPEVFAGQMRYLQEHNYQVISLLDALELVQKWKMSPRQPSILGHPAVKAKRAGATNFKKKKHLQPQYVVLTFDDGFRDFYTEAFPVLKSRGYQATVFLPTGIIDGSVGGLRDKQHLNWDQVRELHGSGVSFGSHTKNHRKLYEISREEIGRELRESRERLENQLRLPVRTFAYPYAFPQEDRNFIRRFTRELQNQGYRTAVTTSIGQAGPFSNPYCLKRLPVNKSDGGAKFQAKLEGDYNWLGYAQWFKRTIQFSRPFQRGRTINA